MASSDHAACAETLRGGSRSFHAAGRLLPAGFARDATALYAFCRVADDAIDHAPDPAAALPALRARLDALYAGAPHDHPADRAFAALVARHALPRDLPDLLFEGFAWDAEGRRYADFAALMDYAARVAGTVGAMMALLMGVRDRAVLARATELGMAMQLSNIARDVGEDARNGRLYLPLAWLAEAGIEPAAFLAAPAMSPALRGVVARLLVEADLLYARALPGIAHLPAACRPAIQVAAALYAAIGRRAGRPDFDCVAARAVVPPREKAVLAAGALVATLRPRRALAAGAPDAAWRLLSACPAPAPAAARGAGRMVELFSILEARQHAADQG